jgi:hypothetical protein
VIESKGGDATSAAGSGGGGAIAVEYASLEASATLLDQARAQGGATGITGGAGTVFVRGGAASQYGRLIVDNGTVVGHRRTILPSLGKGLAQSGSDGATLVTDRSKAIPAYFVGHWVEVRASQSGPVKGTWRIAEIGVDGLTVVLSPNAGEPVTVDAGDSWQGVYRFDEYAVRGDVQVVSLDPIRVYSEQVITGTVETDAIHADRLVVKAGATLTQRITGSATAAESLAIEVRELVVESGGVIDVSSRGYAAGVTYPSHRVGSGDGGSHLGEGGLSGTGYETFGSVVSPRENGSGSSSSGRGGGAVRVIAERVQVDGSIRANGERQFRGGAGGSIWIQTSVLAGTGVIESKGGDATSAAGSGGGGAIAVEYASLEASSTLLDQARAQGGATGITGGAGTVYLRGPSSTLGSLVVSNTLVPGNRRTILPSLGRGVVQPGSSGGTILTTRATAVPAYFVGSWVEVEGPDRVVKGLWQIASVSGTAFTLAPKVTQPFTIAEGDRWRGLYRFDNVTVAPGAILVSTDPIVQLVPPLPAESRTGGLRNLAAANYQSLYGNDEAPLWVKSEITIAVGSIAGSYRITLGANAVSDPDGISGVQLTSGGRALAAEWTANGATFLWAGRPGQLLHLVATDAHTRVQRPGWLELPPLPADPAGTWQPQLALATGVTPVAVAGGTDWSALGDKGVWLYGTAPQPTLNVSLLSPDEEISALTSSGDDLFLVTREHLGRLNRVLRSVETLPALPVAEASVAVVSAGDGELAALLLDARDPAAPVLRLAQMSLAGGAGEPVAWLDPSATALPVLASPALLRTTDRLHLFGLDENGAGVVYSWPTTVVGEPLTAAPEISELAAGWRGVGAWELGAVLLADQAVRLLADATGGWTEVARVDLATDPLAATVAGTTLVILMPGEVLVYDIATIASPVLLATYPGSSYTSVEAISETAVLLWSPRMPVSPLRFDLAAAVPGDGFTNVIVGLP